MTFDEILDAASAEALACKLSPTTESTWRKIARTYAKRFNTSLVETLALDPYHVALQVFEDNLESIEPDEHLEQLLDILYTLSDPEYVTQKEKELEDFIQEARRQEEERIREGRPIHPAMAKDNKPLKITPEKSTEEVNNLPSGGSLNLDGLNEENER